MTSKFNYNSSLETLNHNIKLAILMKNIIFHADETVSKQS